MKYYHSYQFKDQQKHKIFSEKNKIFLYSLVCSVHSSIQNFGYLDLYGDKFTKEIFIEDLALPYTKFINLKNKNKDLFIFSKIETNKRQRKKFCQIDIDFFFTKPFKFSNDNLLFLYEYEITEKNKNIYLNYWIRLKKYTKNIPKFILDFNALDFSKVQKNYNMSILYCNNNIFKDYFTELYDYIQENSEVIKLLNIIEPFYDPNFEHNICVFLEEFLFTQYLIKNNIPARVFNNLEKKSIIHVGGCKTNECEENILIEKYTAKHYPEHFSLINEYINIWKNLNI